MQHFTAALGIVKRRNKYLLLPGLPEDSMCLDANPLHCIHYDQSSITQSGRSADLAAEVHMPRGVYQIDKES